MRSDHLSKHLKTHLSTKKASVGQQQVIGQMPTLVSLPQNTVKLEQDMIEDVNPANPPDEFKS